jgi:hypothetical protein
MTHVPPCVPMPCRTSPKYLVGASKPLCRQGNAGGPTEVSLDVLRHRGCVLTFRVHPYLEFIVNRFLRNLEVTLEQRICFTSDARVHSLRLRRPSPVGTATSCLPNVVPEIPASTVFLAAFVRCCRHGRDTARGFLLLDVLNELGQ